MMRRALFMLALATAGCGDRVETSSGPMGESIQRAAIAGRVPRDLMVAIAAVEGGLKLKMQREINPLDEVPVAGALELRHGAFDSLARGAQLANTDEETLRRDTDRGTHAGALVLAELGRLTDARGEDWASWRTALEELSGLPTARMRAAYASEVFETLRKGGTFRARDGEWVTLAAHDVVETRDDVAALRQAVNGTPEVPGAQWIDTECSPGGKCSSTRGAAITFLAIHDTEGGWPGSVATLQNDPGKSVHYIIDADGSRVGQFLPESYKAYHVGNSYYNSRAIGIEHVGFAADGFDAPLYDKSVEVVQNILSRNPGITLDRQHIIGHYQVPDGQQIGESSAPCSDYILDCETSSQYGGASNHRDPGTKWQWCQYMEKLGGECECNDAHPHFNCTTDLTQAVRCVGGVVEIRRCQDPCVVMAIGVDDQCDPIPVATDSGTTEADMLTSDTDGGISDADGGVDGVVDGGTMPPGGGGCSVGGGDVSAMWLAMLVVAAFVLRTTSRGARRSPLRR